MKTLLAFVAASLALQASAMNIDAAAAQKWQAAKMVRYRVEGVHNARVPVVFGDYEGKADVIDRITVEFSWDNKKNRIVGPVTITDGKTEVSNIRSDKTNCPPPKLNGEYEHFQTVSSSMTTPDQIQIKGIRTYPPASVSNYPASCSMRSIPGSRQDAHLWLTGAEPVALALPPMPGNMIVVSPDRKSFTMKGAENWVWTFTPTILQ